MGGQSSKEIRNFKETKNKVFVEIRSHLKRFKANKYPVADKVARLIMTCSQKI